MTRPAKRPRALLVAAPFGLIEYPHLGISLIKAAARRDGFHCDAHYASIAFAKRIGFDRYQLLANAPSYLLIGDRMFARALAPGVPSLDEYLDACSGHLASAARVLFGRPELRLDRRQLAHVERMAQDFVDDPSTYAAFGEYDVIGFSSTFGQNTASLAMAKRVKDRHPHVSICIGGANCEGPMGKQLVRSFEFVDYAFAGDGDLAFPRFLEQIANGHPIDVPGVFSRQAASVLAADYVPLMRRDMDDAPYPDFDDYFAAFQGAPERTRVVRAIPVESSRGCWWGEKHHCTFCGLNGMTMAYRAKSPRRFADEVRSLVERYGVRRVMAADNILDARFVKEYVPHLRTGRAHDALFYEVKANLSREDLEALATAGITEMQPGIESLSTHILRLIDKGCTALQNVQLLKWAEEVGTTLVWAILCGIPGETREDYEQMAELMHKIPHLQPALGFNRISIDRFAPYFRSPERYGLSIYPAPAYRYVYDLPDEQVRHLAFWWCYDHANGSTRTSMEPPAYARAAVRQRIVWASAYKQARFEYRIGDNGLVELEDTRPCAPAERVTLDALESAVFLLADKATTVTQVLRRLRAGGRDAITAESIEAAVRELEHRLIIHREGDRFLALASRSNDNWVGVFRGGGLRKTERRHAAKDAAAGATSSPVRPQRAS